ncbi:acetyltransferase [Streptomyces sp. FH025]|nr:acetyltransferase [Streptomyces sp. FH025]
MVPALPGGGRTARPVAGRAGRHRPGGAPAEQPRPAGRRGLALRRPLPRQPGLLLPGERRRASHRPAARARRRERHLPARRGDRPPLRLLPRHQPRARPDRRLRIPATRRRDSAVGRTAPVPRRPAGGRHRLGAARPAAGRAHPALQGQPAHPDQRPGRTGRPGRHPVRVRGHPQPGGGPLMLDDLPGWGAVPTPAGEFRLNPVRLPADLELLAGWMNDPEVDEFWELAGPPAVTERHVRAQLDGDGRSVPCLGLLDGAPMSYWEVYRADLDPLARHYPARPHDTGVHLLLGPAASRGRGLGAVLLAALADLILGQYGHCGRIVAEPDVRNRRSVRAFERAGFRAAAELDLPGKRAALMIRDRDLLPA